MLSRWILIGFAEVALTLILASIAPIFINSTYPWVGWLIWLGIIGGWLGSILHIAIVLTEAARVRRFFLRHFPQESDRSLFAFTGLSLPRVQRSIADWQDLITDPDFQDIGLSPLDFIKSDR